MLLHLLNLTILAGILWFLLYSPAKKILTKKHEAYAAEKQGIDEALASAIAEKTEADEALSHVENEIAAMKEEAAKEIEGFVSEVNSAAIEEAEGIITDAKKRAEAEKARIIGSAQDEIAGRIYEKTEGRGLNG